MYRSAMCSDTDSQSRRHSFEGAANSHRRLISCAFGACLCFILGSGARASSRAKRSFKLALISLADRETLANDSGRMKRQEEKGEEQQDNVKCIM